MSLLFIVTNWNQLGDTGKLTGSYLPEVAHPYEVFKNAGLKITFCSPNGGVAPIDPLSREMFKEDPICNDFLANESVMEQLSNTLPIKDIDLSQYKIIYFAGGHGPMFDCVDNKLLLKATRDIYEAGGIVAAVCHGTVGLLNVKLSDGSYLVHNQKVTSFTNAEEDMIGLTDKMPFLLQTELLQHGADFVSGAPMQENVVVSGRIVTGQNPASAKKMAESVVEKLKEISK